MFKVSTISLDTCLQSAIKVQYCLVLFSLIPDLLQDVLQL